MKKSNTGNSTAITSSPAWTELKFDKEYFLGATDFTIHLISGNVSRYKSWEYCYNYFSKLHSLAKSHPSSITEAQRDQACLNLAFYMASWGMYRGSSFLLQMDYRVYKGVVDLLLSNKWVNSDVWDLDNLLNENTLQNLANQIYALGCDVSKELSKKKKIVFETQVLENEITKRKMQQPTKTVITKILLGTVGCIPALDQNFCNAVGVNGNEFDVKRISNILYTAFIHKHEIEQAARIVYDALAERYTLFQGKQDEMLLPILPNNQHDLLWHPNPPTYPIMKLLDMYYFTVGLEKPFRTRIDELNKGNPCTVFSSWGDKKQKIFVKQLKAFCKSYDNIQGVTALSTIDLQNTAGYLDNATMIDVIHKLFASHLCNGSATTNGQGCTGNCQPTTIKPWDKIVNIIKEARKASEDED